MVTDDQIVKYFEEMQEIFKDSLPNLEQEPIRFKYYVKLYLHFHQGKTND